MDGIYQHYIIDLSSNNNFVQVPTVQGDGNNIRGFEVELISHNVPYVIDAENTHVWIAGTKPDTKEILNECSLTDEGYILVDITSQMSAVAGRGDYQIMLVDKNTNAQLKSFPFIVVTTKAAFDAGYINSSDEFQVLVSNINKVEPAVKAAEEVIDDLRAFEAEASAAEEVRIASENERIAAETIREENEAKRQEDTANAISAAQEATENAVSATNDAISATEDALAAANLANEATQEANTATQNAIQATEDLRALEEQVSVSEADRVSAEIVRQENEELRQSNTAAAINNAEVATQNATQATEDIRALEEQIASAEAQRQTQESIRQTNEEARQANTATAIENANAATDRANLAAEACEGIVDKTGLIPSAEKGAANGVATLDSNKKLVASQLPKIIVVSEVEPEITDTLLFWLQPYPVIDVFKYDEGVQVVELDTQNVTPEESVDQVENVVTF